MINLYTEILIQIQEPGETGLDPKHWYKVIGTYHRIYEKDGKTQDQDFLMVIRPDGTICNVFPSKVKVRRAEAMY